MIDYVRFYAAAAHVLEGRSTGEYMHDQTSSIRREPVGVCAAVHRRGKDLSMYGLEDYTRIKHVMSYIGRG
jgi:hypothetical protein